MLIMHASSVVAAVPAQLYTLHFDYAFRAYSMLIEWLDSLTVVDAHTPARVAVQGVQYALHMLR
jgi:hypothetical protein